MARQAAFIPPAVELNITEIAGAGDIQSRLCYVPRCSLDPLTHFISNVKSDFLIPTAAGTVERHENRRPALND